MKAGAIRQQERATAQAERLKDRRDYRAALIERRNQIDIKIDAVEKEIAALK
jgi:hypothetical protein